MGRTGLRNATAKKPSPFGVLRLHRQSGTAVWRTPIQIGTEMERAMDNDDEKTVESMVERTITDAIMVNPRAENVRDFQFTWEGDQMHVTFKVKGSNWDEEIEISL